MLKLRVIPVIDVKGGVVVHAAAGKRESYRPIESKLVASRQPIEIARVLLEKSDAEVIYLADLDSLVDDVAPNGDMIRAVGSLGSQLWLDAAWSKHLDYLHELKEEPIDLRPIFSLEKTSSLSELEHAFDFARKNVEPVFSLDLFAGQLFAQSAELRQMQPLEIVAIVCAIGFRDLIVLEIANVGSGRGPALMELIREIAKRFPEMRITSGGGIRSVKDLLCLQSAGCASALVSTALHQGTIASCDLAQLSAG